MKRFFALGLALLLLAAGAAHAAGPDDDYVQIYSVIQDADTLSNSGALKEALAKYREAQSALQRFQRTYPDWNPRVASFRLTYVSDKITALASKVPVVARPAATATNLPAGTAPASVTVSQAPAQPSQEVLELRSQLNVLQNQVHSLEADKQLLEAKLKEALSVQPAAVDPRELTRAEERIRTLEKENELIKVDLAQQKTKASPGASDAKSLADLQQALTEANRKLAEQMQKADALAKDKKFLEAKLAQLSPTSENSGTLESTRKALAEANRQLAAQKDLATRLAGEKDALQAKLKNPGAENETMTALRAENEVLKKQAAEAKAAAAPHGKGSSSKQLAEARTQLAALESERDVLRVEKLALENRLKERPAAATIAAPATNAVLVTNSVVVTKTVTVTNMVSLPAAKAEEPARLKALEREREDLQKQLTAANKELNSRKSQKAAAHVAELENQLAGLKARLDVYEARQVPFTAEELAAFSKPAPQPTEAVTNVVVKAAQRMDPATKSLVLEAQRYFANHQLDKAEAAYTQVLHADQANVIALANLATIQLENNHLEAAETNIVRAVALAPDDAYSLSILGYLRYRQRQFDAALDALGRAAQHDPQNPTVQNYLGITLAEKGLRGPAETAFRKAIQIEPNYADAHVNLAMIYVAQQPPALELARWHYQRALTAGHVREPYLDKALEIKK